MSSRQRRKARVRAMHEKKFKELIAQALQHRINYRVGDYGWCIRITGVRYRESEQYRIAVMARPGRWTRQHHSAYSKLWSMVSLLEAHGYATRADGTFLTRLD